MYRQVFLPALLIKANFVQQALVSPYMYRYGECLHKPRWYVPVQLLYTLHNKNIRLQFWQMRKLLRTSGWTSWKLRISRSEGAPHSRVLILWMLLYWVVWKITTNAAPSMILELSCLNDVALSLYNWICGLYDKRKFQSHQNLFLCDAHTCSCIRL